MGPPRSAHSNDYPTLAAFEEVVSSSLGPPSLSFKYLPGGPSFHRAEFALTLDRTRYLTFLGTKASQTMTHSFMAFCVYKSCNNPTVMLSLSFPIHPGDKELQGTMFATFLDVSLHPHRKDHSGGYRYLAWIDGCHLPTKRLIKVARLWSKDGPTHTRRGGPPAKEDQQHVCTVKVPETVKINSDSRIVLDEIHGRILLLNETSIIVLSFA